MFAQGTHGIQRCPSAVAHFTPEDPIGILNPSRWPVNLGASQSSCVAALKINTAIYITEVRSRVTSEKCDAALM